MYTIKHAASQVGITAATLRAWERRYGVINPHRTEGGYRVYGDEDVVVLRVMKELVDQGWSASMAAAEALERAQVAPQPRPARTDPEHARDITARLIDAGAALDAADLAVALDDMFALGSFETVARAQLLPALGALGQAWADGRISVAGEHLISHAVMRRLSVAYEAAAAYGHGPRIALGLAPDNRHELGLLAFAVAARRRGLDTDYLGADLPIDDWLGVVAERGLAAVVLAIPTEADIVPTGAVITALRDRRPDLVVAVGGAQQEHAPQSAVRLGHDIIDGAERLASHIAGNRR
ncbi:MerR family transcriptional regulator [Mycolicibacterium brumae]|uniref:Transcriptional regulator n=1 Tax=Mycolicibacterium brumae TaxID=85968 RepID=A0A2G5PA40_9MYCO|nr:MerR family transcriptional regulator [Mycolicibacterium brumae]MCV7192934.1 MerR family transcriptional regulator [Mycolicibacterium brumae]PIB75228.1 transcriptional regulator [Mycolicibacterium brumae]RWA23523.1 hypothetical protein MBRU_01480 [Mycolicibacterium brumae DSM 44177]UWW08547.1 MerR family transcriptional regulator [Mycolicibacterium brumae]